MGAATLSTPPAECPESAQQEARIAELETALAKVTKERYKSNRVLNGIQKQLQFAENRFLDSVPPNDSLLHAEPWPTT